jgi:hypothetical protein
MRYIAYGLAIFAAVLTVAFATGNLPRDATASHNEINDTMKVLELETTSDAKALPRTGNPWRGLSVVHTLGVVQKWRDARQATGRPRVSFMSLHHMNFGWANNASLLHGISNLWTVQSLARFRPV